MILQTLVENQGVQNFMVKNEEIVESTINSIDSFKDFLTEFVKSHPDEFIAEDLHETFKNIRVFSEVATSQFITEMAAIGARESHDVHTVTEGGMDDYI